MKSFCLAKCNNSNEYFLHCLNTWTGNLGAPSAKIKLYWLFYEYLPPQMDVSGPEWTSCCKPLSGPSCPLLLSDRSDKSFLCSGPCYPDPVRENQEKKGEQREKKAKEHKDKKTEERGDGDRTLVGERMKKQRNLLTGNKSINFYIILHLWR